jgi:predicted RNA-binding protein with PUA-like domain
MNAMRYWLMKSEPSCYGIEDLEREGTNMWEGCRNYLVRNYFRDEMEIGDKALFYHSNANPTGVVGIMEIVSEAYADPTQFDPSSEYYDAKSTTENPRWLVRDVRFVRRLPRCVTLKELKETPGLDQMAVCQKGQRLSVLRVTEAEWKIVMELSKG